MDVVSLALVFDEGRKVSFILSKRLVSKSSVHGTFKRRSHWSITTSRHFPKAAPPRAISDADIFRTVRMYQSAAKCHNLQGARVCLGASASGRVTIFRVVQ